jgi:hypothetical protein
MALRRSTGTRADPRPRPPRPQLSVRGRNYLIAHACFACRKSWKVRANTGAACPHCGACLHEMGRAFKAPKQADAEQSQKVRPFGQQDFASGTTPAPERLRDVEDFIRRNPEHPARIAR